MSKEKTKQLIRNAERYVNDIDIIYLTHAEDNLVEAIKCIIETLKELEDI